MLVYFFKHYDYEVIQHYIQLTLYVFYINIILLCLKIFTLYIHRRIMMM